MTSFPRSQLWNACLGNLFEHYDRALFGFLSPFLAPLIFPEHEPITALILTYAIIPLGMLARPIGSLVFGYIGDVHGRQYALFLTLAGMSFVSGFIALTPTYQQIGFFAPLIFCLGRALQNFLAAGETMGGAIFLLENSPEKRHDLLSGIYNASTMGGHLLASFGVFFLGQYNMIDPGWRYLYLCGCITALFGCIIRRLPQSAAVSLNSLKIPTNEPVAKLHACRKSMILTPIARAGLLARFVLMRAFFREKPRRNECNGWQKRDFYVAKSFATSSNLKDIFWTNRKALLSIVICSGFGAASYSVALVLMNGFIPLISTLTKAEVMKINTYLLILDFCALPFFGWLASKIPREKLMISASLGAAIFSIPLFLSLKGASLAGVIGVRIAFVLFGVSFFASFHAWAGSLISSGSRYAVISLGYALGSQLLGSPTAAFALWCFQKTGMVSSVAWYWMLLGLASGVTLMVTSNSRDKIQVLEG